MTEAEVMKQLEEWGTEQNRKIYRRHGAKDPLFGVSYANFKKLKKQIKVDHDLARKLWATGNYDAMIFATMIADPKQMSERDVRAWGKEISSYPVTDAFSAVAAKAPAAQKVWEKWVDSKDEWLGRTGWLMLNLAALQDHELPDAYFEPYLEQIEREIHSRKNRVRDAMVYTVISIGLRNPKMEKKALAAAKRIGKVEVDHGETGCKTPDITEYIGRARARKR